MKTTLSILLMIAAVLACGCTATAPVAPVKAADTAPPDLTGTWAGTSVGYEAGKGFTDFGGVPIAMVVTGQQGRIFAGHIAFAANGTEKTVPLAGIISRDGKTFAFIESVNGYTTGEIIGADTIELTHLDNKEPYSVALDTLKKV